MFPKWNKFKIHLSVAFIIKRVCLLAQGKLAYFGSIAQAKIYFPSKLKKAIPNNSNPADIYIEALSLDVDDEEKSKKDIEVSFKISKIFIYD